ncbi:MAG TPA: hypothetical protein VFC09_09160 [Candidatus Dormibacteraeota bacterium]|nr:hypothetical protein [Candidatus Dormibacteraeota bacterium]
MVGLLIILALGLVVLFSVLYATRLDDNHDVVGDLGQHPGYILTTNRDAGLGIPQTTLSPVDTVFTTELDVSRALHDAALRHRDGEGDAERVEE